MSTVAFLWRPEQAAALRARLAAEDRVVPLSQKSLAAALREGLANVDTSYFHTLEAIDLGALRAQADDAVRRHEALYGPALDRPAIWHNAHESGFVAAAASLVLARMPDAPVLCASAEAEPEFAALQATCAASGRKLECLPLSQAVLEAVPQQAPADLLFSDAVHVADHRPWRLVVAVALADLADQMRAAARHGRVVVAMDADASGDATDIHALARAIGGVSILPLGDARRRFDERGDNTLYANLVERQLAAAFTRPPVEVVVSDLRRVETELAVRAARASGAPITLRAHGGGIAVLPYRFEDDDVKRNVWTQRARKLDGADRVSAPRAIRPPPPHRLARIALRALRLGQRPQLGVVVTSGELFAAPEAHLAPMIEAFGALCAGLPEVDIVLRLRRLEDCEAAWRAALPDASFAVETRDKRPFIAFARSCDAIVEIGSESTTFIEAAANAVPYIRVDAPPAWLKRFDRPEGLVPHYAVEAIKALLNSPMRRVALGLRQFREIERDTRPDPP